MEQKFTIVEKKYNDLRMLPVNPRILDLNIKLDKIYYDNYSIFVEIKKILNLERKNLEVLYELISSLSDRFTASNDNIHIIPDDKEQNFYVLEGNRRLMCMYLLEEFSFNNSEWKEINDYIVNELGKENSALKDNWEKILICINDYQKLNVHYFNNISITLVNRKLSTEEELWQIVNNRHTAGSTGKSAFPRLLYLRRLGKKFSDLYKKSKEINFQNKDIRQIKKEILKKIHFKYDRTIENLSNDINKSLWCTWVISKYKQIN
ncbi:hypothetical protein [Spiroplasma endosymbiont of Nomada rufipes]|uniref:hypothetical protein n=1 Tax=Spiroplasma endosymbiont of Nomada rufipes TaxID=3077933 RepID=UPI00376EE487